MNTLITTNMVSFNNMAPTHYETALDQAHAIILYIN